MRNKPMVRGHLINKINRILPEAKAAPREDFDGQKEGIWLRGSESTHTDTKGDIQRIYNYWQEGDSPVHPKLTKILEDANWYDEAHDAGTLMLWPGA